ncbi:thiamine pyrophosphate-binding protein [Alkalihalobacillus oceani]|uniref:thiamine pyrophosphate-binding protein n=1 Tax=Halalkalibacter oceani TaxID=1653776 RepID=UPI0020421C56|nr:thiamine pyrophosphate-binding protein [Halalkalibacter oceani]MCM3761128.1 thiamine pyrophosphate-binding protein [Halalkalibacter oceani]
MLLGEAIIQKLKASGIQTVFGVPGGGTSSDLLCTMDEHGVEFILTQHETTAAIMASVVGEITQIPGVCIGDLGPGALSFSPGLAYAQLDRAPLLLLTDRYGNENVSYALRQNVSHHDSFSPITKLSSTLSTTNWNSMLNRGFKVALASNYGPVHFDIPNDIVKQEVDDQIQPADTDIPQVFPAKESVQQAVDAIRQAKKPVIIAGLGINFGTGRQFSLLEAFASQHHIPVFKTAKAKGAVSDDHPLSLGLFMGGKLEAPIMENCDLIITVGLDPVELLPKKWTYPQRIVSISTTANLEEVYHADIEVAGNLENGLRSIHERLTDSNCQWQQQSIDSYRKRVIDTLTVPADGLTANQVVDIAQQVLPPDTLMTTDVGASKLIVTQLWKSVHPRSFFISNGLATMGFSFPAAMALQHLYPEKTVASLTGDGGFMMKLPEIATAVQNKWPVIMIVFSDQRLSLMDVKQKSKGYKKSIGNQFTAPNYVALAESFGANGWSADNEDDLKKAIQAAVKSDNRMPSIIEAKIDPSTYHKQFQAIRDL